MSATKHSTAPSSKHDGEQPVEAVVAVFADAEHARNATEDLRSLGLEFDEVPRARRDSETRGVGPRAPIVHQLSEIFYDPSNHITTSDVAAGATKGAAIGAIAGAVLVALPGIGLGVVVAGALGGAFIGGVAAIDEGDRSIQLPTLADYRKMLRNGKSLVVVYAEEGIRMKIQNRLNERGAEHTYQHPPVLHSIRKSTQHAPDAPHPPHVANVTKTDESPSSS